MTSPSGEPFDLASLPKALFAFPGPLRDMLVAAVLDGRKTATTGLVADYEHGDEALPRSASGQWWWTPPTARWPSSR